MKYTIQFFQNFDNVTFETWTFQKLNNIICWGKKTLDLILLRSTKLLSLETIWI